jgi:hypothetical protein
VRILCTNQALDERRGTQSYLEAVVPALRALGHDVELYTLHSGALADRLRAAGFVVHDRDAALDPGYDVVHAQHASTALEVRAMLPKVPIVFASHSWFFDIEDPPREANLAAVLVFNDIVAERVRASVLGGEVPVHRLTQPVVIGTTDQARIASRRTARRALAMSRTLSTRISPLREACRAAGIELTVVGQSDEPLLDTATEMMRADIVFTSGRGVLEALALGRAAFVYDELGEAGFVTEDSYPSLESCGFTSVGETRAEGLGTLLARYDRGLGPVGRDLVVRHHAAGRHAATLVGIYRSVAAPGGPSAPPDALRRLSVMSEELHVAQARARGAEWHQVRLERLVEELDDRLRVVQAELDAVRRSTSWRVTAPLRRVRGGQAPRSELSEDFD